jgi:hypothetical protein
MLASDSPILLFGRLSMDFESATARIYEHLENDHVEKAVMACLRIARAAKDYLNAAIFLRELYPDKGEVSRALYDDTSHLNKEAQKFLYETSLNRWLELHTVDLNLAENEGKPDEEKRNVFKISAGEFDSEIEQWNAAMSYRRKLVTSGIGKAAYRGGA